MQRRFALKQSQCCKVGVRPYPRACPLVPSDSDVQLQTLFTMLLCHTPNMHRKVNIKILSLSLFIEDWRALISKK